MLCKERSVLVAHSALVVLLQIPSVHRGESSKYPGLPLWWWCKDWTEWTAVSSAGQIGSGEDHSFEYCQRWFCRWHCDNRRACKGRATEISYPVWPSRWVSDTVSEIQRSQKLIASVISASSAPFCASCCGEAVVVLKFGLKLTFHLQCSRLT